MKQEEKLQKNWTEGSARYSGIVEGELNSFKRQAWTDLILSNAGTQEKMKILDIGTGPGFFAILMSLQGHQVTAVDCTEAMLEAAKQNAFQYGVDAEFLLSDAQELPFEDERFDLVISRNVAWTIIDAEKAYKEWKRVLKPGGRVLIFDANWNIRLFDEEKQKQYEQDLAEVQKRYPAYEILYHTEEELNFRRGMPMCSRVRPQWDFDVLLRLGYRNIFCDTDLRERIYTPEEALLNRSTPMFLLRAEK